MRTPALAAALALTLVPLSAQEPAPPAPPAAPAPARPPASPQPPAPAEGQASRRPPRPPSVPLKVQVTVSRLDGEKKTLSLPYSLLVSAPEREWGERTSLRMGIDVPVKTGPVAADKEGKPSPTYQYRTVGTRIDCRAFQLDDRYQLELTVEQSSLNNPTERAAAATSDTPILRTFSSTFSPGLRDGQSVTTVVAADPVSGENVRIEVSLNVVR
jgi:hypothetical protein